MLEKAIVKIDGLTVIAGENDTGKSTVGKVLFCIIKAISKYEDFRESKMDKIEDILEELFFFARRNIKNEDIKNYRTLKNIFHIREYVQVGEKNSSEYIKKMTNQINRLLENDTNKNIENLMEQLKHIISTPENKHKSMQNALNKVFHSEFNSSILKYGTKEGWIKLYDKKLLLLDINIIENKLKLGNNTEPIEIKEATFIETPLILNNHDLLSRSQSILDTKRRKSRLLGVPYTTFHTKDLFDKLKSRNFEFEFEFEFENKISESIASIINGEIVYDDNERDFVYIKNKQKIPIKNTATGIKAFGIIQLLINSDFINRKSLLILDEPEVHLHPKWQLKYAQIIATLVKHDIPVMANSHSPYMIEALKRYSDKENLEDKSNFYLAESGIIEDKNKLSEIYEKLSEPYDEFEEMESERFSNG